MNRRTGGAIGAAVLLLAVATVANVLTSKPVVTNGACAQVRQGEWQDPKLVRDSAMHYWDPIVFPGIYGYFQGGPKPFNQGIHGPAHWHTFFGNRSLNPFGIQDPDTTTSCSGGFKGDFWTPNLLAYTDTFPVDGIRVEPKTIRYTFTQPSTATAPPSGLGIIAKGARWDCGPGTAASDVPHVCTIGTIQATLAFPRFWDGVNLHLPGEAHMSPIVAQGFPIRLPQLRVRVDFGISTKFIQSPIRALSVGGVPLSFQNTDGTFTVICNEMARFCEDERSFHMDVLFP